MKLKKGYFYQIKPNSDTSIYHDILAAKKSGRKLLAVLLDPDKIAMEALPILADRINESPATHIFVGGSIVEADIIR